MVWKKNGRKWTLYINGEPAGYVILVKYIDGSFTYQGIAFNKKTKAVSRVVSLENRAIVQDKVEKLAKAQRRK